MLAMKNTFLYFIAVLGYCLSKFHDSFSTNLGIIDMQSNKKTPNGMFRLLIFTRGLIRRVKLYYKVKKIIHALYLD